MNRDHDTPIEALHPSVRAYNGLKRTGLLTVGRVLETGDDDLLSIRNFGWKSFDELTQRLIELGYLEPGNREPAGGRA